MSTYLYRAISTEETLPESPWDSGHWVGESLGRDSGYLSRSSAVDAGERSGIDYKIVRSKPVDFTEGASKRDKLVDALVDLVAEGVTGDATRALAEEIQRIGVKP